MNTNRPFHLTLLVLVLTIAFATVSFISAQDTTTRVMTEEEAQQFTERFDEVFNIPDLAVLDEIFSPDYIGHLPLAPEIDLQGLKDYIDSFRVGVPDMIQTTHATIIGEHELVVRVTYTGTHTGTLFGIYPPTGNPILMEGIGILRFNDEGLVEENWAVLDMVGVLAQIGAFPPAAPSS